MTGLSYSFNRELHIASEKHLNDRKQVKAS